MTRMRQRRGTTAEWASANPTLAEGELGLDETLNQLKVGDGVTAWSSLAWLGFAGVYTAENARDDIGTALVEGAGIDITVNDGADTITVASTITQYTDEMARDALGTALVAGDGVDITVDDGADTITLAIEAASDTNVGGVELATNAETATGTSTTLATTPAGVASVYALLTGEALLNTVAASGATETLTLAPEHKVVMDQSCTFTFPTPVLAAHTFTLHLSGAFTPTFPGSVDWPDAAAPTYTTPALYVFHTYDSGTNWQGARIGKAFG